MRKLIVSMNITLDGFMSGQHGELDWHFKSWTSEMTGYARKQLSRADTIVLGGATYQAMSRHWPAQVTDTLVPREDMAFAAMMNNFTKIVFSSSISGTAWKNTIVVREKVNEYMYSLKRTKGKDIIIFGSGKIVDTLLNGKLIDEYILWIHPYVLVKGNPLFRNLRTTLALKVTGVKVFHSGVTVIHYCA